MTLDSRLLEEALAAKGRLIEAEHAADVARADFHRAVRHLQLGGASMREAAEALGLSHQRVHQIVEAAGGSRRWRKGRDKSDQARHCSFCGREQQSVKKLVAGPGVFICEQCIAVVTGVVATGQPVTTPIATIEGVDVEAMRQRCSFCGKRRHEVAELARARGTAGESAKRKFSGDVHICGECLNLCGEILAEQLG
ncbi:MAG: hypothetical protein LC808_09140 [Actinobacteria bacterium]|nr:hypothetical protein [Actinomycetota bacterium]